MNVTLVYLHLCSWISVLWNKIRITVWQLVFWLLLIKGFVNLFYFNEDYIYFFQWVHCRNTECSASLTLDCLSNCTSYYSCPSPELQLRSLGRVQTCLLGRWCQRRRETAFSFIAGFPIPVKNLYMHILLSPYYQCVKKARKLYGKIKRTWSFSIQALSLFFYD